MLANLSLLVAILLSALAALWQLRQTLQINKFKKEFLPIVWNFHEKFPDFKLISIGGNTLAIYHENNQQLCLRMWTSNVYQFLEDHTPEHFHEPANWLYDQIYNSGWDTALSPHMRQGLIAAIRTYEHEIKDQEKWVRTNKVPT